MYAYVLFREFKDEREREREDGRELSCESKVILYIKVFEPVVSHVFERQCQ